MFPLPPHGLLSSHTVALSLPGGETYTRTAHRLPAGLPAETVGLRRRVAECKMPSTWCLGEETLKDAIAAIVDFHHKLP